MQYLLAVIGANLVSIALAIGALWLAFHDKSGWGWFLFAAIITATSVSLSKKK